MRNVSEQNWGDLRERGHAAEAAAVERYMASSSAGVPILTGYRTPLEQLQTEALSRVATGGSLDAVDELQEAQRQLEDKSDQLDAQRDEVEDQRAVFQDLHERALAEVQTLEQVEAKRLEDERVRIALEKQRRQEERRRAEEAARQNAEEERRAAELAKENGRLAALAAANQQAGLGGGDGAAAVSAAPAMPAGPAIVCPVRGPTAYADTWGAGRSGGRHHEGVDMISPGGTPLVAAADGAARFSQNPLGGNAVNLVGDNGDWYYYAHLSAYEGSSRQVRAGEVIGYVGSTGNTTVNHLHFQVHRGGGAAINPTPYVRNAGC